MSIKYKHNTIYFTLLFLLSILLATVSNAQDVSPDSLVYPNNNSISSKIYYFAKDSIISYPKDKIIELYNEAFIKYDDFELKAGYIRFNMNTDMVYAHGILDTADLLSQEPIFIQGDKTYNSDTILFNMKSKKGKIQKIATQEGEGFLYGHDIKKMPDNSFNIKEGIYTTCNHPEPHFFIKASKVKLTDDKKIITGPANLVIGGVKTPIFLPFGYFPLTDKNPIGIIIPSYNFSASRGYGLNGLGFYVGYSDYWDNKISADIYTGGSYTIHNNFGYNKRYKYSGRAILSYSSTNDLINPNANAYNYSVNWTHRQDSKANPFSRFTASVDMRSPEYSLNNNDDLNRRVQASYISSINYNRSIFNGKANLEITASHNLTNSADKKVFMKLPEVILRSNTAIFPFKTKKNTEKQSILSKIQFTPTLKTKTNVSTFDSLMFTSNMFNDLDIGAQYSVPFSMQLVKSKYYYITPSFGYTGTVFTKKYYHEWNDTKEVLETKSTKGIYHLYDYNASLSLGLNPTIYGMFNFNGKTIKALRHVIDPYIRYSYNFNILDQNRYYQDVQINKEGDFGFKSHFNQGTSSLFSVPGSPTRSTNHQWGSLNFGIQNNIEIKVKDNTLTKEDSASLADGVDANELDLKYKKLKLFERFDLSSNYDLDADSFNLAPINLGTSTVLGNNFTLINTLVFNPYAAENGEFINKYFWEDNKLFPKLTSITTNISYSLTGKSKTGLTTQDKINNVDENKLNGREFRDFQSVKYNSAGYVDFDIPYSLNLYYSIVYRPSLVGENTLNQSVTLNGDLSLTKNWKILFDTGYDFSNNKIASTQLTFKRDLHCWQMSLVWVPFGQFRSYGFAINVKASILQDLKLHKRRPTYDYFQ